MPAVHEIRDVCQAGKDRDPRWYRIHRRLSIHVTALLLRTSITLPQVSLLMLALGTIGALANASHHLGLNAVGWVCLYASFLLDKVDGEIARYRRQESVAGILVDRYHHRLVEPLLFLCVGLRAFRATHSTLPVFAALAAMLAANLVEETQHLPAYIAAKFARETRRWPAAGRRPSAWLERAAAWMRPLKTFRTFITVVPLVMGAILAEAASGRPVTTWLLLTCAVALWVYAIFQAFYYIQGRLEAEIESLERQLPPLPPTEEPARNAAQLATGRASEPASGSASAVAPVASVIPIVLALMLVGSGSASAGTYYVDGSSAQCSPSGPGTESQPYCTIGAALAARGTAGNTILVKPGTYRETVTFPASGTAANPIVLRATGPGVILDGADDFSNPALWEPATSDVWLASSVTWAAAQVFADGVRLTPSTSSPSSLGALSFRWVSGQGLYVNVGGDNPGLHATRVGHRANALVLSGRSWITVDGFVVTRTDERSFNITSSSNDVSILDNQITFSNRYGIYVSGCARVRIANNVVTDNNSHAIMLTSGSNACVVEDNEGARNAVPGTRAANGLHLYGAPGDTIRRNRWHDNQDSGQHLQANSDNCISYNNRSWNNGDHGFDHLLTSGTIHINDVAYGNYKDGFSIEGTSPNTRLSNCIAVNNGLSTNEYDLWVDGSSTPGFESDDNVFWNSTSQRPFKYNNTTYSTISSYRTASGEDSRSLQADPRFVNAAAGDFHLLAGSPAIDNANSGVANWPARDAEGTTRRNDPATADAGLGPIAWADRGALEYRPPGAPPVAALALTPASGRAPLLVTADASGSTDADSPIVTYRFDFGDGVVVGPQPGSSATHGFGAGSFTVSVTVTDEDGLTATTTGSVVAAADQAPVVTAPVDTTGVTSDAITLGVSAADPDGDPIASLTADFSALPPGAGATFTPAADQRSGVFAWTPAYGDTGSYAIVFHAGNALTGSAGTQLVVTPSHLPPAAALTLTPATGNAPLGVIASAAGSSDPQGTALTYRFEFGDGAVAGPQSSPIATHTFAPGGGVVTVHVTNELGLTSTAAAPVTMAAVGPGPNLVGNPSFESDPAGWGSFAGAVLSRVTGGFDGDWSIRASGGADLGGFGIDDSLNWVESTPGAGVRYRFGAWVRSVTGQGAAKLQIHELAGGTRVGATILSLPIQLSPRWQFASVDFVTQASHSSLDFQILDQPVVVGEVFEIDNVSIFVIPDSLAHAIGPTYAPPGGDRRDPDAPAPEPGNADPVAAPMPPGATPTPSVPSPTPSVTPSPAERRTPGISFETKQAGPVRVDLYDVTGRRVRRLLDGSVLAPGLHKVPVDGRGDRGERLDAGIYFYLVQAAERSSSGKFVIVR